MNLTEIYGYTWEQRKLSSVATISGGGTPSTNNSEYWNGKINWFAPAEIGDVVYVSESKKKITELGLNKSSANILPVGTVLYTSRAGIGKTAILSAPSSTNQGFQSIIPGPELDSYFVYAQTDYLKKYGQKMGSGSTFDEISGKQLSKFIMSVPNLKEQINISLFIKKFDQTIASNQRKQKKPQKFIYL